jgi:hypothetical protein
MHRPTAPTAALRAAAFLSLFAAALTARAAAPSDDLQAGRAALERGDGPEAVDRLESALLSVPSADRPAVLDDLRRAYERAASQAEAAGDSKRARLYRENLQIISRPRKSASTTPPNPTPKPEADLPAADPLAEPPGDSPPAPPTADPLPPLEAPGIEPVDEPLAEGPAPSPDEVAPPIDPLPTPGPSPAPDDRPSPVAIGGSGPAGIDPRTEGPASTTPSPVASDSLPGGPASTTPSPVASDSLPDGPASTTPYPNPGPSPETAPERPPAPSPSIAEVLRSADAAFRAQKYDDAGRVYAMLAERGQLPESHKPVWAYCRFIAVARRINAQPNTPAEWSSIHAEIREVRALAPEIWFSEYLRRLATERSAAVSARPSAFVVRGQGGGDASDADSARGAWKVLETKNFRIFHADSALADRFARRAEQAREELFRYWTGSASSSQWSPRCDVYLYPDASIYSRMTGQPADTPGFSTMGLSGGKVVARRINLRADAKDLVEAVTPHEVSHVVLADLFPTQQIPRWADEGMAVLSEPIEAQAARLADLEGPLSSGRVFRTGAMLTSPNPDGRFWELYMAQSASLTRFLVQLDSPERFVAFLKAAERLGPEAAIRDAYGFDDLDELHSRWLAHARKGPEAGPADLIAVRPEGITRGR